MKYKSVNNNIKHLALLVILLISASCNNGRLELKRAEIEGTYTEMQGSHVLIKSRNTLQDSKMFVWGASVIKGDDGRFHMFYSRWDTGKDQLPFSDAWVLNSEIAYAVSDQPDRDFRHVTTILKGRMHSGDSLAWDAQAVHNPHIKKYDGKYYLYYIGNRDPGPQPEGTPGWGLNKRNRCQQSQLTGVLVFENFDSLLAGKFIRSREPLLLPRTRVRADKKNILFPSPEGTTALPDNIIIVNPSVVFRESDNKYLLYFKGNIYDPQWKGVHGVAVSDSPEGPFAALDEFVFDIKTDNKTLASAEDPYVWYHKKHKRFYAIIKDFTGKITGSVPGLAILESENGLAWETSKGTSIIEKKLTFENGYSLKVSNLERPQLLTDNYGNPLVLYAACSVEPAGGKKDGSTFNVHIPLGGKPASPAGRR